MATNYTLNTGLLANGQSGIGVMEVLLDSTQILDSTGAVAGYAASDCVSIALPMGTQILGGMMQTKATWTGNIKIGQSTTKGAADEQILAAAAASSVIGGCVNFATLCNVTTTQIGPLTAAAYLNITIVSANTTGKLRFSFLVHTMDKAMAG
jgi:hypothetical protein